MCSYICTLLVSCNFKADKANQAFKSSQKIFGRIEVFLWLVSSCISSCICQMQNEKEEICVEATSIAGQTKEQQDQIPT